MYNLLFEWSGSLSLCDLEHKGRYRFSHRCLGKLYINFCDQVTGVVEYTLYYELIRDHNIFCRHAENETQVADKSWQQFISFSIFRLERFNGADNRN